jgi:hypothetical protein
MRTIIISMIAVSATGAADPWTMGVEPRVGVTKPTSKLGAMAVGGLEVDFATPVADHQLIVAIDFSLTQPSYSASATSAQIPGGMTTYDIHQTEVVLGLVGDYRFAAADQSLVPHAGAGPVVQMLKTNETEGVAPGENTAQQTKVGFELEGGLDIQAGPGLVAGELRVIYSGLDTPLAGGTNAGNIELAVGYRLVF